MLEHPQGGQWKQHLYCGGRSGGESQCAPWDGRFDAAEEVSRIVDEWKDLVISVNMQGWVYQGRTPARV